MPASELRRGPNPAQHRRMHVLWRLAGVTSRADRLALTSALAKRPLATSSDLEPWEAYALIRYMEELDNRGQLYVTAQRWLAAHREERNCG